jgi:hypothetical protein
MSFTTEDTEDRRKNPVGFSPLDEARGALSNVDPSTSSGSSRATSRDERAGLHLRVLSVLGGPSAQSNNPGLLSLALRHFVAATAVLALVAYIAVYARLDVPPPIKSDGYSYYVYLPSWVIYKDFSFEALADDWYGGRYPSFTGLTRWPPTGRWLNLHPIGTAILEMPFFVAADALSQWSNLPRDGFSLYYQHAAGLAGLTYFVAGVAILRRLLMRRFGDGVVLATLVCVTWGTNLFHYGVFDSTFSHAFAFFEICAWIWLVERWWADGTPARSVMLGLLAALIVLTRHTNAVFLLVLPLFGVTTVSDMRLRMRTAWERRRELAVAAAAAAVAIAPQLALYKWITGSWFVNAYVTHSPIGFRFASPHLAGVLFSTQKGLFFWSPLLLLAVIGLFAGSSVMSDLRLPALVVLAIQTYLIASWSEWQFGASYGHRAFTDGLGLMAPFLAAFLERIALRRNIRAVVAAGATAAVVLSIAQMVQYWIGILPYADTTWSQYRALFLRFH